MTTKAKYELQAAGTLKSLSTTYWAVHACAENEVFYVIFSEKKKVVVWDTLDNMKDASDMVLFESKKIATDFVKHLIKTKDYPEGVVSFEVAEIIPSYVDDSHWYETLTFQSIDVKAGKK